MLQIMLRYDEIQRMVSKGKMISPRQEYIVHHFLVGQGSPWVSGERWASMVNVPGYACHIDTIQYIDGIFFR